MDLLTKIIDLLRSYTQVGTTLHFDRLKSFILLDDVDYLDEDFQAALLGHLSFWNSLSREEVFRQLKELGGGELLAKQAVLLSKFEEASDENLKLYLKLSGFNKTVLDGVMIHYDNHEDLHQFLEDNGRLSVESEVEIMSYVSSELVRKITTHQEAEEEVVKKGIEILCGNPVKKSPLLELFAQMPKTERVMSIFGPLLRDESLSEKVLWSLIDECEKPSEALIQFVSEELYARRCAAID